MRLRFGRLNREFAQPEQVAKRLARCYTEDVLMSAITSAKLEDGVAAWATPARERRRLAALIDDIPGAPFDVAAAPAYGPVRDATGERKKDHLDERIAAHAVSPDVALVTNDER
ncbi:VapC toxin family PIN domain ribonuclease [Burkholderia sp. AU28942]|uniref:PIN domain-containing protein n=1 Tax=Burkholderia TaxID=32008 RepID=UPI00068EAEB5|nr:MULTISPECIES: PIN domain-containing protein [Burkholderia]AOK03341.1 twitching motility protein PilT [Burkholderia latens]MCA8310633.1 VapC toxin family PIN domain ribonuclease [Burkholderia sp. AU28942]QTO48682.1 VapC toxin family PIN domain ribonuclease [Burkholderia latens]